jgi:hypothetical protein
MSGEVTMKINIPFLILVCMANGSLSLLAYDPDHRDRTLYDKNQNQKDWYYQDKWRYDKDAYLEGENQPLPPSQRDGRGDQPRYNGNNQSNHASNNHRGDQVIHGDDLIPAWDYRDNWRYNRDAYLQGNNRPYHYPDIPEYQDSNR